MDTPIILVKQQKSGYGVRLLAIGQNSSTHKCHNRHQAREKALDLKSQNNTARLVWA